MKQISLCMIAPEFFPVWGGVGSYIIEIIKNMPKNVDVHVITLKRNIPGMSGSLMGEADLHTFFGRPIDIHYVATARETFFYNLAFQAKCLVEIPGLTKKYGFDILHSHLSFMPDVFLQLFHLVRIPTVVTTHSTIRMQTDATPLSASNLNRLEWSEINALFLLPIINSLQQKYVQHISKFIAVSNMTSDLLQKHLKVESEKITVIHNGVDPLLFSPSVNSHETEKHSTNTVIYMGRLMAKKGLNVLIKAVPKVLASVPDAKFIFAGGDAVYYETLLKNIGVSNDNFEFIGHVGYYERPQNLRKANVFVNPSFFENCSISILEAMSCGLGVIASNVGGNPELIESGKNGFLTKPNNADELADHIVTLLKDENLCKSFGAQARKTIETSFTAQKCANETFDVYRRAIQA